MQIAERCVAHFHYTLTNEAGEQLDTSRGSEPMAYLHGRGNIIPGLEKAMDGKKVGDAFKVTIEPGEAYGERVEQLIQVVPRSAFGGVPELQAGMRFQAETQQGPVPVVVTEVGDEEVTVDGNHPLAGQTLNFDVEVTEVREATVEEVMHGHVHGAGGHQH